jgi:MoaA/NifB/PqqE/SkfB family radical SAM enzyme
MTKLICTAPWSSLTIEPYGKAKICSVSSVEDDYSDIASIMTSNTYRSVRESFCKSEKHHNCNRCWREEDNSTEWLSRRSFYQPPNFYYSDNPDDYKVEYLDLRWSNTCNLNCVYCGPTFSSKWASLNGMPEVYRNKLTIPDEYLQNLKTLMLVGGEPTLIKENIPVLQRLLVLNPEVDIEITSNLTYDQDNTVYNLLRKFSNVTMIASFETIGKQFEYIRNGAKWDKFYANLALAEIHFKKVQANMVYMPLSAFYIVDAITVAMDHMPEDEIYIREQWGPPGFDCLSKNACSQIVEYTTKAANSLPATISSRIQSMLNYVHSAADITYLEHYERFDKLTNQNHKEVFPDLYNN